MLTSSGYRCDVCGNYILGLTEKDGVYNFKLSPFVEMLHHCYKCKPLLLEMFEKQDISVLPDGRVRRALEKAVVETPGNVTWGEINDHQPPPAGLPGGAKSGGSENE